MFSTPRKFVAWLLCLSILGTGVVRLLHHHEHDGPSGEDAGCQQVHVCAHCSHAPIQTDAEDLPSDREPDEDCSLCQILSLPVDTTAVLELPLVSEVASLHLRGECRTLEGRIQAAWARGPPC